MNAIAIHAGMGPDVLMELIGNGLIIMSFHSILKWTRATINSK